MKQTQKHKRLLIAGGVLAVMALCAAAWFGFTAMGNAQLEADSALEKPGSSSDSVEKVTGIDFFPSLPDSIENPMEAYVNDGSWSF